MVTATQQAVSTAVLTRLREHSPSVHEMCIRDSNEGKCDLHAQVKVIVNDLVDGKLQKRMMGIALGAEDYCANLKTQRSPEGCLLYTSICLIY